MTFILKFSVNMTKMNKTYNFLNKILTGLYYKQRHESRKNPEVLLPQFASIPHQSEKPLFIEKETFLLNRETDY